MDELIRGNVRVTWDELGEGWNGDYNPDDPDDEELLRFSVYVLRPEMPEWCKWEEVDSYCTAVPTTATDDERTRGLEFIMEEVYDAVQANPEYPDIKHICGSLSWMTIQTLRTDHPVVDRTFYGPNLAV